MRTKTAIATPPAPSRVLTVTGSKMLRLVVPISVKADEVKITDRTFEGLSAVWDLDLGNDVIHKGAFKASIAAWKKSPVALPLLNSHDHFDIMAALGQLIDAKEQADGLWTKWEIIEGLDGDRVLQRITPSKRTGRAVIGSLSIGYEPLKFDFEQPAGTTSPFDRVRNLREVSWKETSLVLFPMAPGALVDAESVKVFGKGLTSVDGATLTVETRQELRRLASRIGTVLKGTKTDPAPAEEAPEVDEEEVDEEETPPSLAPAPEVPAAAPPAPTPSEDDDGAPPAPEGEATGDGKSGVYLFGEALQQRMTQILVGRKVSNTLQSSNTN